MSEHTPLTEAERRREARKFGTETPHEPTDEFVRRAFAEGAKSLWPDSRDPGWCVTFDRWLAARTSTATADTGLRERVEALAEEWGTFPCGGTEALRQLRAALNGAPDDKR